MHRSNNTYHSISLDFDKCERCRKIPATIECGECGTSAGTRPMKFCYECDKSYHKMLEKDKHARGPIRFDSSYGKIYKVTLFSCLTNSLNYC
jgi:hypothetical protein